MKRFLFKHRVLLGFFLLLILISVQARSQEVLKSESAVILDLEGIVEVKKEDAKNWSPAGSQMELKSGDEVKTGDASFCMIMLKDGTTAKLGGNTHAKIEFTQKDGEKKSKFQVFMGRIWSQVNKSTTHKSHYEVKAPHTLAAVRGTAFEVICEENQDEIMVFEGLVDALAGDEKIEVTGDRKIAVGKRGFLYKPLAINRAKLDQWQKWNLEVDGSIRKYYKENPELLRKKMTAQQLLMMRRLIRNHRRPYANLRKELMKKKMQYRMEQAEHLKDLKKLRELKKLKEKQ